MKQQPVFYKIIINELERSLIMGLFKKKICSICGGEIGLLGNRKLEDGNMCKKCAAQLSPWFSDRRRSTIEDIKEQLAYREDNKKAVEAFNTTLSLGRNMKVLFDEDAQKFMVTSARNLAEANPDVLDYSQVTGCDIDIDEDRDEDMRTDKDGNRISYVPPRYFWSYDFKVIIRVNHPYFDEISFQLNPSSVEINRNASRAASFAPDPMDNVDYCEYTNMANEIKKILTTARKQGREQAVAAPKVAVVCACCGATTMPDAQGRCEFCGGAVKG